MITYHSTMQNFYFCFCSRDGLGMGSDEHFGVYVNKTLTKGDSRHCRTFANEQLSQTEQFNISDLEVEPIIMLGMGI